KTARWSKRRLHEFANASARGGAGFRAAMMQPLQLPDPKIITADQEIGRPATDGVIQCPQGELAVIRKVMFDLARAARRMTAGGHRRYRESDISQGHRYARGNWCVLRRYDEDLRLVCLRWHSSGPPPLGRLGRQYGRWCAGRSGGASEMIC